MDLLKTARKKSASSIVMHMGGLMRKVLSGEKNRKQEVRLWSARDYQENVLPSQVLQFTVLQFRNSTYENCAVICCCDVVEITEEDAVKGKAENTKFKTVLYTMMFLTLPL